MANEIQLQHERHLRPKLKQKTVLANGRTSGPTTAVKMTSGGNLPATIRMTSEPNWSRRKTRSGQKTRPGNRTAYRSIGDGTATTHGSQKARPSEKMERQNTEPHPQPEPQLVEQELRQPGVSWEESQAEELRQTWKR